MPHTEDSDGSQAVADAERARLMVAVVANPDAARGMALLLCDADGMPLPNQLSVSTDASSDEDFDTVTVRFAIDGRGVRWGVR